MFSFVFN